MQVFWALTEFERDFIKESTAAGLEYARSQGRIGGRPPAMDDDQIEHACRLIQHSDLPVAEIAHRLGVSRSVPYRHFPGGRGGARAKRKVGETAHNGASVKSRGQCPALKIEHKCSTMSR